MLILVGAAAVVATYTFPYWRPLLLSTVAEEPFPGLPANLQTAFVEQLTREQQTILLEMAAENREMAVALAAAALQAPVVIEAEENPPDTTIAVAATTGSFAPIDAIRWAQGTATVYQFPDNRKVLRLEDFQSANGPDLFVLLSASAAPRTREEVELSDLDLELGRLKANIGNQNYEIPPEIDLSLYNSVVIYCQAFDLVLSTATI
jgi:hypothetical protein